MLKYNKESKLDHDLHEAAESKEWEAKEHKVFKDEKHEPKVFGKVVSKLNY